MSRRLLSLLLAWGVLGAVAEEPSAGAAACAFATIVLSEDFTECAAVLVHSIRATQTPHDVVVLVLPFISASARSRLLEAGANHVVDVQEVGNPNSVVMYKSFKRNYSIMRVWQLSSLVGKRYDKAIYMDSDMVMTRNSDELCLQPELSAARDLGAGNTHGDDFNAGMMVLEPSEERFAQLLGLAQHVGSASGGVQPLFRAAFPDWTELDHLQDNVIARVFKHQPSLWDLSRIRSIHFTGPVKPCFTAAEDFLRAPGDDPFRVWHEISSRLAGGSLGSQACSAGASDGCPEAPLPAEPPKDTPAGPAAPELWRRWFPVQEGGILQTGFGLGEGEYTAIPAYHVCRHGCSIIGELAERIFAAGFSQLQGCLHSSCPEAEGVAAEVSRELRWMQRTLKAFLSRASMDAQVDVDNLGSIEAILSEHADVVAAEVLAGLEAVRAASLAGTGAFVFDMVVSVARQIRQREQLLRWHLTYALLSLLWRQYRQLQAAEQAATPLPPVRLELPQLKFHNVCCSTSHVLTHLLGSAAEGHAAAVVRGPLVSPSVEAWLELAAPPHLARFALEAPGPDPGTAARTAAELEALRAAGTELLIVACPGEGAAELLAEQEYMLLHNSLEHWSGALRGVTGAKFAGCGFAARHAGIVEAVAGYALQRGLTVSLAADGAWWLQAE